jgi:hypothetical protein
MEVVVVVLSLPVSGGTTVVTSAMVVADVEVSSATGPVQPDTIRAKNAMPITAVDLKSRTPRHPPTSPVDTNSNLTDLTPPASKTFLAWFCHPPDIPGAPLSYSRHP